MSISKPSGAEEEYFVREEAARRQREALENAKKIEQAEREAAKKLHHMKCPKCGFDLQEINFKGVSIDKCFNCGAMVFDAGEFEMLAGNEDTNIFSSIVNVFRAKKVT
ncbi:MAG: zf-TFIIB domain-containing protein [Myxococcales bacterium]|nr:zf-TFIIB domain-containing protein [Myxococcales bacterium]